MSIRVVTSNFLILDDGLFQGVYRRVDD